MGAQRRTYTGVLHRLAVIDEVVSTVSDNANHKIISNLKQLQLFHAFPHIHSIFEGKGIYQLHEFHINIYILL